MLVLVFLVSVVYALNESNVSNHSYAPSPVNQSYAPSPVNQSYAPSPVNNQSYAPSPANNQSYAPSPVNQTYAPSPVNQSYAPSPVNNQSYVPSSSQIYAPSPVQKYAPSPMVPAPANIKSSPSPVKPAPSEVNPNVVVDAVYFLCAVLFTILFAAGWYVKTNWSNIWTPDKHSFHEIEQTEELELSDVAQKKSHEVFAIEE